jgi:hypothetical protein
MPFDFVMQDAYQAGFGVNIRLSKSLWGYNVVCTRHKTVKLAAGELAIIVVT